MQGISTKLPDIQVFQSHLFCWHCPLFTAIQTKLSDDRVVLGQQYIRVVRYGKTELDVSHTSIVNFTKAKGAKCSLGVRSLTLRAVLCWNRRNICEI